MELIIIALVAGVALGSSNLLPAACLGQLDKIITGILFVMLAALGAQIGSNDELLNNLAGLGVKAVGIAILSVAGSVGLLWFTARCFSMNQRERNEKL